MSFDEDLLTLVERVDKAILEKLLATLDARAILSFPSVNDPLAALYGKIFYHVSFLFDVGFGLN